MARGGHLAPSVAALVGRPQRSKYAAQKVVRPDGTFDSKHEARCWDALVERFRRGEIAGLERQVRYRFVVNGVLVGWYTCDFRWIEVATGEVVVADAKSPATRKLHGWGRTRKLMLALYGLRVQEV